MNKTGLAGEIHRRSIDAWGAEAALHLLGTSPAMAQAQERLARFAAVEAPALVTGASGVGKELFARSLYLLGRRTGRPFVTVNCAQFQDDNLIVSELFGHKRGAFTGAAADRRGLFEVADGGVVFLDEVGELSRRAQAMLLRALGQGEIVRLGETRTRRVDVRVVAATNRNLEAMVADGRFRQDLYYRLAFLRLHVPTLAERDDDWRPIADHFLAELARRYGRELRLAPSAVERLSGYAWPGNVRELRGLLEMGFCLSSGAWIEADAFASMLAADAPSRNADPTAHVVDRLRDGEGCFWDDIHRPFIERELNRSQVRAIVHRGLEESGGSYKRLLDVFQMQENDYAKFMDFLRHHRLKPGADATHVAASAA